MENALSSLTCCFQSIRHCLVPIVIARGNNKQVFGQCCGPPPVPGGRHMTGPKAGGQHNTSCLLKTKPAATALRNEPFTGKTFKSYFGRKESF